MMLGSRYVCRNCQLILAESSSASEEIFQKIIEHLTAFPEHEVITRFVLLENINVN